MVNSDTGTKSSVGWQSALVKTKEELSVPWITLEMKCMMRSRHYDKKHVVKHTSYPQWESRLEYFHSDKIIESSVVAMKMANNASQS